MNDPLRRLILNATAADDLVAAGTIQSLWSGYGSIDRYRLIGSEMQTVVVKHVRLPEQARHPSRLQRAARPRSGRKLEVSPMTLESSRLAKLSGLAVEAARAAGRIIRVHRNTGVQVRHKDVGDSIASQVVTEVDLKAQVAILEVLRPSLGEYGLALLAEESPDDGQRHEKPAFWCIDPMDGTLAFINGTPGFAVSIALVARDGSPLIGVVYDPVEDALYHAAQGQGARKNGQPIALPGLDPALPLVLRTDISFRKHPRFEQTREGLQRIAGELGLAGVEIQCAVGAVMNACGVLQEPNSFYFKYPRQGDSGGSLWDYAATACLFGEAGAVACDAQGRPMELNRADSTFMNHRGILYATDRYLAERVMAVLGPEPPAGAG